MSSKRKPLLPSLNIENINEPFDENVLNNDNTNKSNIVLNCVSTNEEEMNKTNEELKLFQEQIKNITNDCDIYTNPTNTSGSSGTIYETTDGYIKYSELPLQTSQLFNKNINCSTLQLKINKSINENANSIKFAELGRIFPFNIMKIYSTSQCKNKSNSLQNESFSNIINMEKIQGITLGDFLTNLDLETNEGNYELMCCLLQLIYIMMYANYNGYIHNDLTTSNIMVYYIYEQFELDKLNINENNIKILFKNEEKLKIPIIKLIDFSYSTYINPQTLKNKILFGETVQAIKIILNKLKILKKIDTSKLSKKSPIEIIDTQINECFEESILSGYFAEMEINKSSNGYRLLPENKIISLALNKTTENSLVEFFSKLFQFIDHNFSNKFDFHIISKHTKKSNNLNDKKKIISNSDDKENNENTQTENKQNTQPNDNEIMMIGGYERNYKKYMKYKTKYLKLKKSMFNMSLQK